MQTNSRSSLFKNATILKESYEEWKSILQFLRIIGMILHNKLIQRAKCSTNVTLRNIQLDVLFSILQLTNYLSQYILQNRSKFFDKRNHMVAICEGDILAEAFGVRAFHRSQVT